MLHTPPPRTLQLFLEFPVFSLNFSPWVYHPISSKHNPFCPIPYPSTFHLAWGCHQLSVVPPNMVVKKSTINESFSKENSNEHDSESGKLGCPPCVAQWRFVSTNQEYHDKTKMTRAEGWLQRREFPSWIIRNTHFLGARYQVFGSQFCGDHYQLSTEDTTLKELRDPRLGLSSMCEVEPLEWTKLST